MIIKRRHRQRAWVERCWKGSTCDSVFGEGEEIRGRSNQAASFLLLLRNRWMGLTHFTQRYNMLLYGVSLWYKSMVLEYPTPINIYKVSTWRSISKSISSCLNSFLIYNNFVAFPSSSASICFFQLLILNLNQLNFHWLNQ